MAIVLIILILLAAVAFIIMRVTKRRRLLNRLSADRDYFAKGLAKDVIRTVDLGGLAGPLTARETMDAVMPVVLETGSDFVFSGITGRNVSPDGKARVWDLVFHFPGLCRAEYSVQPCDPESAPGGGPVYIGVRLRPPHPGLATDLPGKLRDRPNELHELRVKWETRERALTSLPLSFLDSPDALELMAVQGAGFSRGVTDISLSSHVMETGETVWRSGRGEEEVLAPFAASGRQRH